MNGRIFLLSIGLGLAPCAWVVTAAPSASQAQMQVAQKTKDRDAVVGPRGLTARQVVKRLDRDGDGRISQDEFRGRPKRFSAIDADGDGFVSTSELETAWRSRASWSAPSTAAGRRIEWIDTHVHPIGGRGKSQNYGGAVKAALDAITSSAVAKMILMPPPQVDGERAPFRAETFASAVRGEPERLAFLGGGGSLNPQLQKAGRRTTVGEDDRKSFERRAEEILAQGAVGFGEISIQHLSLMQNHPFESVPGDHPLLLLLADIAARHDVVIDIHFDVVVEDMTAPSWLSTPPNPSTFKSNIAGFERLLAHNRGAKIVWAHAGSDMLGHWTVALSRRLLAEHPNLYMSLRMAPGRAPQNHPLGPNGIKPEWLRLLSDYPDRFVIGGDQFFMSPGGGRGNRGPTGLGMVASQHAPQRRQRTDAFLAQLPEDLARKIAFENAMRLYKLQP